MSQKKLSDKEASGCFLTAWTLFVTTPMWLMLLFAILSALGESTPTYAWALYWCYAPANVLGVVLLGVTRVMAD